MKFKIHCRWEYSDISDAQYSYYQKQYLKHLSRIDFSRNHDLLRYFGVDFFHDSILHNIEHNIDNKILGLQIIRQETDLCDINDYRIKFDLKKITEPNFLKKPIIYDFNFTEVTNLKYKITYEYINGFMIMDTEIDKDKTGNKLSIYQDASNFVEFNFKMCKFSKIPLKIIKYYTGNKLNKIPYCDCCRGKLLTKKSLFKRLSA
jgi:hypothetical protein